MGPLAFTAPAAGYILGGAAAAAPPLWEFLSALPEPPVKKYFPGFKLLANQVSEQLSPSSMKPWQKALCISSIFTAALWAANPDVNQDHAYTMQDGPVIVAIDNGWSSAPNFESRLEQLSALIESAETSKRNIIILPSAELNDTKFDEKTGVELTPAEARTTLLELTSQPWPTDHTFQLEMIEQLSPDAVENASIYWLSDGLQKTDHNEFIDRLTGLGPVSIYQDQDPADLYLLSLAEKDARDMKIRIERAYPSEEETVTVNAYNDAGQILLQEDAVFASNEDETTATFTIPREIRTELSYISLNGIENTAGSILLIDESWQERTVGIIKTANNQALSGETFLRHALNPFTDLHIAPIEELAAQSNLSVMIMTDDISLQDTERTNILQWIQDGGTFIRFAGSKLATLPDDILVPVELTKGRKYINGQLTSRENLELEPFDTGSPYFGISIPESLNINSIIQAKPSLELSQHTWAQLSDGSPLITARQEGEGWMILKHVTADLDWSNLPFSGDFFIDMLRADVSYSLGLADKQQLNRSLPLIQSVSASGEVAPTPPSPTRITQEILDAKQMDALYPPGRYGEYDVNGTNFGFAYNISDVVTELVEFGPMPSSVRETTYEADQSNTNIPAFLLLGGALALLADGLVRFGQNGHLPAMRRRQRAASENKQRTEEGPAPGV